MEMNVRSRSLSFEDMSAVTPKTIRKGALRSENQDAPIFDQARALLRRKTGPLTQDQVRRIAEQKMADLNANDVDGAMKIVAGTARSMGVEVVA